MLIAGSNWHPRILCHRNHFVYSDMPQFIMDSYEDCHGLPHLYLLDKYGHILKCLLFLPVCLAIEVCVLSFRFDPGGPGSCLKRYSDPTFFKKASAGAGKEKIPNDKKVRRIQVWLMHRPLKKPLSTCSTPLKWDNCNINYFLYCYALLKLKGSL